MTERLSEAEVEALSGAFSNERRVEQLLERAGLRRERQPRFRDQTAIEFWWEINAQLEQGLLPDGRQRILTEALRSYPGNAVFSAAFNSAGGSAGGAGDGGAGDRDDGDDGDIGVGAGRAGAFIGGAFSAGAFSGVRGGRLVGGSADGPVFGGAPIGEARYVSVVCLDAMQFSRRGALLQADWREGMWAMVGEAARRSGLPPGAFLLAQDRGDGILGVVDPVVSKATLAADFVRELRIELHRFNLGRSEEGRIRMRMALHAGDVIIQGSGFAGQATIVAARLVDSSPVRQLLELNRHADLALILSPQFHADTVAQQFRGLDPSMFQPVSVSVSNKYTGTGWITVPGERPWRGPGDDETVTGPGDVPPDPRGTTRPGGPAEAGPADAGPAGSGAAEPVEYEEPGEKRDWDFLISADEADEAYGAWIAWLLQEQGKRVHLTTIAAARPGEQVVERLQDGIVHSKRTLALLSPNYLASKEVGAAWGAAWKADPDGTKRKLIPVRIERCQPVGLLGGIRYIDLAGLDAREAQSVLMTQLERSIEGSYRPKTPPPFPGRR